jgi:hypothetical protein
MIGVTGRGSVAHLTTHSIITFFPVLLASTAGACTVPTDPARAEATLRARATPETNASQESSSPPTHLDQVWTDDPKLAPLVRSAVERWRKATGRQWVFAKGPRTVVWGNPAGGSMGRRIGDDIVMSAAWSDSDWLGRVVVHELGHYFRAGHTGDPWSVMYESVGNVECLSRSDLEFVCDGWPCTKFEVECDWLDQQRQDLDQGTPIGRDRTAPGSG